MENCVQSLVSAVWLDTWSPAHADLPYPREGHCSIPPDGCLHLVPQLSVQAKWTYCHPSIMPVASGWCSIQNEVVIFTHRLQV